MYWTWYVSWSFVLVSFSLSIFVSVLRFNLWSLFFSVGFSLGF